GTMVNPGNPIGGQHIDTLESYTASGNGGIAFSGFWGVTPINPPLGGSTIAGGMFTPSALLLKSCEKNFGSTAPCVPGGVPGSMIDGQMLWSIGSPLSITAEPSRSPAASTRPSISPPSTAESALLRRSWPVPAPQLVSGRSTVSAPSPRMTLEPSC